jgi:hypothetical protein
MDSRNATSPGAGSRRKTMITFLLWCLLLVVCWPLALIAAILYPLIWLLLLPFRLVGIAVHGTLELVAAIVFLPVRLLRAI